MSATFGEIHSFIQDNGHDVRLRVFGDEFYARFETLDGRTCVYDPGAGVYCYADLEDGRFISTGVPISGPLNQSAPFHMKETPGVRNAKFDARFKRIRPWEQGGEDTILYEDYGPNNGLLLGRQLNKGQVRGLAVLVDFADEQTNITTEDVSAMLNAENYHANGNYCSVRDYFKLMSSDVLDYSSMVVGPIRLSHDKRYYVDHPLEGEALDLVSASNLDFAQFDSRGIGAIDAISFLYAGETIWEGELWPHNSSVNWRSGFYRAGLYQITGLGRQSSDLVIGTFCHESAHMLCRFPDLYDYGKRDGDFEFSAGLGVYCLMSMGNHAGGGRTPAPVCAYLRYLAGWCPNVVSLNLPGIQQAVHGAYDTVLCYQTTCPTEFFLVENRGKYGLDQYMPSCGLAVYHCDTKGSNERESGTKEMHYQCSLLQADGQYHLEHNANQGDANDFFTLMQGEVLSETTNPSSRMWDGSDSGLCIADISVTDKTIVFFVPVRRDIMDGNGGSTKLDPGIVEHLQQQKEIIQANLDLFMLTQQLEQEKLKVKMDKVKADTDTIKSLIPAGTSTALSGETAMDEKFGYLAQLVVHEAVKNAAREIAGQVRAGVMNQDCAVIALVNTLDFCGDNVQAVQLSRQVKAIKEALSDQIDKIEKLLATGRWEESSGEEAFVAAASLLPVLGQLLASAPGAVSWAADMASFFRAENTFKSVEAAVPLSTLQAAVASAITKGNLASPAPQGGNQNQALSPAISVRMPNFHAFGLSGDPAILVDLEKCTVLKRVLNAKAAELRLRIDSLPKVEEGAEMPVEIKATAQLAENACAASQSLVQSFDEFYKLVNEVPEGKSLSPLALAAAREYLKKHDKGSLTHLLYLNVVSTGGELSVQKTLWWNRDIVFTGGCVIMFVLADVGGNILASGTVGKLAQTRYSRGQAEVIKFIDLTA